MILKVMVGQRWYHVYKCNSVYNSEIVEVMKVDINNRCIQGKTVQIIESTNNDSDVCIPVGNITNFYSIPYGNSNNVWEFLENQEAPKDCI